MADIVARQRQHRQLRQRAGMAMQAARALEQAGKIGVHVTRETLATGDLAVTRRYLAQRFAVIGHVGHDDQHVPALHEGQVLGSRERKARCQQALCAGFVGEIQKHDGVPERAAGLHRGTERLSGVVRHADADEHDRERLARFAAKAGTLSDCGGQPVVWQPSCREQRQLLAPHQAVHQVDRGDPRFDEVARQGPPRRIDAHPVDSQAVYGGDRRMAVERPADAVEDPPEDVGSQTHAERLADHGDFRIGDSEAGSRLEHFDDHPVFLERRDPPEPRATIAADNLQCFIDADVDSSAHEQERTLHTLCKPRRCQVSSHVRLALTRRRTRHRCCSSPSESDRYGLPGCPRWPVASV